MTPRAKNANMADSGAQTPDSGLTAETGPAFGDGPHGDGPELVGYARVSTRSQNDDSQIAELTAAGCARIFTDHGVSGKLASRPELDKVIAYLRPGDTFVITRLSRAMRSLRFMLDLTNDFRDRGIGLKVLKQDIDTTNATGRLIFHILAAFDEWQRELIVEGTLEGLEAARAKGHVGGMPRATSEEQEDVAMDAIRQGKPIAKIARSMGVSRATIYRAAVRRGLIEPPEADGKGGHPPVPPEVTADVLRRLRAGENVSAVADAAGLSRTTVRRLWKASGEEGQPPGAGRARSRKPGGRPRGLSEEQVRQAKLMLDGGEPVAAVARAFGVSRATVNRALGRADDDG